jgi:hypothetical protein
VRIAWVLFVRNDASKQRDAAGTADGKDARSGAEKGLRAGKSDVPGSRSELPELKSRSAASFD